MLLISMNWYREIRKHACYEKGNQHIKVNQVNCSEKTHILWPVKYCTKAGANLFLLTCELMQGSKISGENKKNIMVENTSGNIILYFQIKTHDSWVLESGSFEK